MGRSSSNNREEKSHAVPWQYLAAGAAGGATSRTFTAPLDRIKMLYQTQQICKTRTLAAGQQATAVAAATHQSVRSVARAIYLDGGVLAFWQGNGINCAKIMPEMALKFFVHETLKGVLMRGRPKAAIRPHERFLSASITGCLVSLFVYPMECVKTRMGAAAQGYYKGMVDCATRTIEREGPRALYRGLCATLVGVIPFYGIDLTLYESLRPLATKGGSKKGPTSHLAHLACGVTATCGATLVVYPLNLVRTQLQAQGMSKDIPVQYTGLVDGLTKIVEKNGYRGLYRGLVPNLLKVAPSAGICFAVYEIVCRRIFNVTPR